MNKNGYLGGESVDEFLQKPADAEGHLHVLPSPEETGWISPMAIVADLSKRIEVLNARIAELQIEVAWYRTSSGHVFDQEIQTIISNL